MVCPGFLRPAAACFGQLWPTAGLPMWLRLAIGVLDVAADDQEVAATVGHYSGGEEEVRHSPHARHRTQHDDRSQARTPW